ncbi:MAG: hypothetical protein EOP04_03145 [Proteobacteria bacterium]|nr:MAG: hypothetical protein EOP04_03145 [Pseudomonadota bacterium]
MNLNPCYSRKSNGSPDVIPNTVSTHILCKPSVEFISLDVIQVRQHLQTHAIVPSRRHPFTDDVASRLRYDHFVVDRFQGVRIQKATGSNGHLLARHSWGNANAKDYDNQFTDSEKLKFSLSVGAGNESSTQVTLFTKLYEEMLHEITGAVGNISQRDPVLAVMEVRTELALPGDLSAFMNEFEVTTNRVFPNVRRGENPGATRNKPRDKLYWVLPHPKSPGSFSSQQVLLKAYPKNGVLRIEVVFKDFRFQSVGTIANGSGDASKAAQMLRERMTELVAVGTNHLKRLLIELRFSPPSIPRSDFNSALESFGVRNIENDGRVQRLFDEINSRGRYVPAEHPGGSFSRITMNRLSNAVDGTFEVVHLGPSGKSGKKVYTLRKDWLDQLPKKLKT